MTAHAEVWAHRIILAALALKQELQAGKLNSPDDLATSRGNAMLEKVRDDIPDDAVDDVMLALGLLVNAAWRDATPENGKIGDWLDRRAAQVEARILELLDRKDQT
jgi:hypothetical protein